MDSARDDARIADAKRTTAAAIRRIAKTIAEDADRIFLVSHASWLESEANAALQTLLRQGVQHSVRPCVGDEWETHAWRSGSGAPGPSEGKLVPVGGFQRVGKRHDLRSHVSLSRASACFAFAVVGVFAILRIAFDG
jgi:hypothetical protein